MCGHKVGEKWPKTYGRYKKFTTSNKNKDIQIIGKKYCQNVRQNIWQVHFKPILTTSNKNKDIKMIGKKYCQNVRQNIWQVHFKPILTSLYIFWMIIDIQSLVPFPILKQIGLSNTKTDRDIFMPFLWQICENICKINILDICIC